MDSGTITIGVVSIVACILPFIFINRSKKKAEQKRLRALIDLAAQHNGAISRHEFCGEIAIGLDEINNYLFFVSKVKGREAAQFIDLAGIKSCRVENASRNVNSKDGAYKVIDKLSLVFTPADKDKSNVSLEFYDADASMQLVGELQLIERWEKLVNDRLA